MSAFDTIYARNLWNGTESLSGPGSGLAPTRVVAHAIGALVAELGVTCVLNAACGDDLWTPDLPGYVGIDLVPAAIERARQLHPNRHYLVADVRVGCPAADLVLLRDALQHMPMPDGMAVLTSIVGSGATWLLASTYTAPSPRHHGRVNVNVPSGAYYCPDLTSPPFALGAPERLIPDGYDYADPRLVADPTKYLGLWQLR